ncbi:hypothetical protein [Streptomyces olivochromogenes]|uniref:hypothetical protein n=1 Tax=Streptomyces olivochromogenes TaxID=1963 RepID=UPI001F2FA2BD|nr:hypothetical protein [Streptomyces olivochromogenes]MCF3130622.1 hypothetical protein [Streptomyces olivochromogenes]
MNDLLNSVLDAHGGLDRWSSVRTLTARLTIDGPFWEMRGFKDAFLKETLEIDLHRQHAVFTPWLEPGQSLIYTPDRVVLRTADGGTVADLSEPRPSYAGYDPYSPWTALQVGYFLGYAMWNYLTTPYLFTLPGVRTREIEPCEEDGATWRRLHVTFPDTIATHTREQVFHFSEDSLLRRLDYNVDVNAGVPVAHYTDEYRTFGGLAFPTRRLVHPRNVDGTPNRGLPGPGGSAIAIDIHDITIS